MLSTQDADSPARRLYRSLGFADLLTGFIFPGGGPPYAVMGAALPLPARPGQRRPGRPARLAAEPQQLVDLPGRARAVQRVEVQAGHALGEQPLAHPGRVLHADLAHRRLGRRRARAAGRPGPAGSWRRTAARPARSARTLVIGMIPAMIGTSQPRAATAVPQPQVVLGVEEHLGDREVGARPALATKYVDVGLAARRPRVPLGERGHADAEVARTP